MSQDRVWSRDFQLDLTPLLQSKKALAAVAHSVEVAPMPPATVSQHVSLLTVDWANDRSRDQAEAAKLRVRVHVTWALERAQGFVMDTTGQWESPPEDGFSVATLELCEGAAVLTGNRTPASQQVRVCVPAANGRARLGFTATLVGGKPGGAAADKSLQLRVTVVGFEVSGDREDSDTE
jgi:hypothetical protein